MKTNKHRSHAFFADARKAFHASLISSGLLTIDDKGVPSIADGGSKSSVAIAQGIFSMLGTETLGVRLQAQISGSHFEDVVASFLKETFPKLQKLRPGKFEIAKGSTRLAIAQCDQYDHLAELAKAAKDDPALAVALGSDYLIKPDIIMRRYPEDDAQINLDELIVDSSVAKRTSLRAVNSTKPILHASVSCKWTLRSDRAQNARSEALNLIRNRRGKLPHIAIVTGEPTPGRLASLSLGTGDIDCVYHIALDELVRTVEELQYPDAADLLSVMIEGKRLRDISDLPFDLAA